MEKYLKPRKRKSSELAMTDTTNAVSSKSTQLTTPVLKAESATVSRKKRKLLNGEPTTDSGITPVRDKSVTVESNPSTAGRSGSRGRTSSVFDPLLFHSLSESETPLRPLTHNSVLLRRKRLLSPVSPVHYSGDSDHSLRSHSRSLIRRRKSPAMAVSSRANRSTSKPRSTLSLNLGCSSTHSSPVPRKLSHPESSVGTESDSVGLIDDHEFPDVCSVLARSVHEPSELTFESNSENCSQGFTFGRSSQLDSFPSTEKSPVSPTKLTFPRQATVDCPDIPRSSDDQARSNGSEGQSDSDLLFDGPTDEELLAAMDALDAGIDDSSAQGKLTSSEVGGPTPKQHSILSRKETEIVSDSEPSGCHTRPSIQSVLLSDSHASAAFVPLSEPSLDWLTESEQRTRQSFLRVSITEVFRTSHRSLGEVCVLEGQGKMMRLSELDLEGGSHASLPSKEDSIWTVELRGEWASTVVEAGDTLHVIDSADPKDKQKRQPMMDSPIIIEPDTHLIIDDDFGIVVLNPDFLVIPTKVASSYPCPRVPIVNGLLSGYQDSRALLFGTMAHELFQECLLEFTAVRDASHFDDTSCLGSAFFDDSRLKASSLGGKIKDCIEHLIEKYLINLACIGETEGSARSAMRAFIPSIIRFLHSFCARFSDASTRKSNAMGRSDSADQRTRPIDWGCERKKMQVQSVCDIEECMWSPQFGVQGNVDAILSVRIRPMKSTLKKDSNKKLSIVPFELKTGKDGSGAQTKARAQLAMYSLMVSDRYNVNLGSIDGGLLYFLKTDRLLGVPLPHGEIRTLMIRRNFLSCFLKPGQSASQKKKKTDDSDRPSQMYYQRKFPPLMDACDSRVCENCFCKDECFTFNEVFKEKSQSLSTDCSLSPKKESVETLPLYQSVVSGLTERDKQYLKKWMRLIEFESDFQSGHRREIWTMSALSREREKGRCIGMMTVTNYEYTGHLHLYTFHRHPDYFTMDTSDDDPLVSIGNNNNNNNIDRSRPIECWKLRMRVGDSIVVSSHSGHFGLAKGRLVELTEEYARICCYQRIRHLIPKRDGSLSSPRMFRLDLDDIGFGFGILRSNILNLVVCDDNGSSKKNESVVPSDEDSKRDIDDCSRNLRTKWQRLLLDRGKPTMMKLNRKMYNQRTMNDKNLSKLMRSRFRINEDLMEEFNEQLNTDQKRAAVHVMCSMDYSCVLGMPGSGKSTVLVWLIKAMLSHNPECRILLTAFTNSAVDHLCSKLVSFDDDHHSLSSISSKLLRVGHAASVAPSLQQFMLKPLSSMQSDKLPTLNSFDSVKQLNKLVDRKRVFACTALSSVTQGILNRVQFDVCLVDEAGQITEPQVIGPLLRCNRFVLFGDYNQLPPMVSSPDAIREGLSVSLFERLSKDYPDCTATLATQYRMNSEIMSLSNELIYDGQMQCANERISRQSLTLDRLSRSLLSRYEKWMSEVVDSSRSVLFLNTDERLSTETDGSQLKVSDSCSLIHSDQSVMNDFKNNKVKSNTLEAEVIAGCVECMIHLGCEPENIAVMAPYRTQLSLIRSKLDSMNARSSPVILKRKSYLTQYMSGRRATSASQTKEDEDDLDDSATKRVLVDTIDRFQGRDCDCVFISLTHRSEDEITGILRDWRRINVALTRAKKKLVLVGSLRVFSEMRCDQISENDPKSLVLKNLVLYLQNIHPKWIIDL